MSTIFTKIISGELDGSFVYRDDTVVAFMDINPINPGHVLVVPVHEQASTRELSASERSHLFEIGNRVGKALLASDIPCDGYHFIINDGRAANQTVPHVHLHVIPRRRGDGLRTVANMLKHGAMLMLPHPVSQKARARLNEQAASIAAKL